MLEYILSYLIVSQLLMFVFLIINEDSIRNSYLSFESKRNDSPTTKWYILYVMSHIIKAPLLAPMILILIMFNGGKLVE
jgi:hypothetical protein